MAKYRRLLLKAEPDEAKRLRHCAHDKTHEIPRGAKCMVITDAMRSDSYCLECAEGILRRAHEDVRVLLSALNIPRPQ